MKTPFPRILVGVLSSFCLCLLARSASPDPEARSIYDLSLDKLAELVVTDTKIAQPRDTVTQRVETIQAADMELRCTPLRNLSELLSTSAGQFVNPLSRNDANWGSYAGLGPKYNTYILDGLPIDSFADAMSLDSWALQAVEIYKGPAAVLYSNYLSMDFAGNEMSLAGITNFILKDKIDVASTRIAVGHGSYNTTQARLYHQNHSGRISYFAGGSYERSDYTNYGTANSWLNILHPPRYEKTKYYAKLSYTAEDDRQKFSFFAHRTEHKGDTGRPNRGFDNQYETLNTSFSTSLGEAWNLQLKAGYRNYDRSWEEDNFPVNLDLRERNGVEQQIYVSDLTGSFRHAGNSVLTMGADLQFASYTTYQVVNEVDAKSRGFFLQEKIVNDRWIFRFGGRANRTDPSYEIVNSARPALKDKSWDSLLWSTGLRYNATPRLSLYGNIGSSFIAPSAKSVCGTIAASDAGLPGRNGQLPNPGLSPEEGTGSDVGLEFRTESAFTFGVRGFLNDIRDAIIDNAVSTVPSQTMSVNAGKVRSYGFEVTLERKLDENIKWFANITHTVSKANNALVPDQDGTTIPFVPSYVANVGLSIRFPGGIVVSPCLQAVGDYYDSTSRGNRQRFGRYQVIDVKIQGQWLTRPSYSLGYALELNNLLNRHYEMPWQFRNPGFNTFVSLDLNF